MDILIFTSSRSSFNSLRPEAEMYINFFKRGHNVTIVTDANSEYGKIYQHHGIKVIDCQPTRKMSLKAVKIIRQELKKHHYDILYATNSKSIPNGAFAALGSDVKVVSYRGTTGGLYRSDPSAYLTHLHPRVDGIACVSEAVRQDVQLRVWKNRDKVVSIHKGHNLDWYDSSPADLREFEISPEDFTLICAVNARPSKGIPVLLEAVDLLSDIDDLHLLLVGEKMGQYDSMIAANNMSHRIHKLGYRFDVPGLIAASEVLIQPSISGEGLPRAVMESMCLGTPPIITTTGGGKEIVENGISGYVVPTHNPHLIAEKVRNLYGDRELLANMGEQGKRRISRDFSCESSTDLYLDYFASLLSH